MDEHKVLFVTCVNNEEMYRNCMNHLRGLMIPEGFKVDVLPIRDAESMTKAYNTAMRSSDAKYKVYLHQDTFIIHKFFIHDVIALFQNEPALGLLGMVGCKKLPPNGVWWEGKNLVGKVIEHRNTYRVLKFEDADEPFSSVEAIDGLLMAAQYDVPWREDLFQGFHFYDTSQSLEFHKHGCLVGVPAQAEAWCIHDCGNEFDVNRYQHDRSVFIKNYTQVSDSTRSSDDIATSIPTVSNEADDEPIKDEQPPNQPGDAKQEDPILIYESPLVSVLIPTYNRPHYLELAVQSVLMQTYKKIEIIITDNSTNLESQARLAPYLEKHPQIKYVKNERDLGYVENCQRGFALASGDYINYLMDDDLFCREKIEKMLSFYLQRADITLVTSYRQLMDEAGNPLAPIAATRKLFEETAMLDGKVLGNFVLSNCLNVIGEPTTVLFRRKDLERFGAYKGKSYKMLIDVASWMSLLSKGNAVYISETLSQFRLHSNQSQKSISTSVSAIQEWLDLIRDARAEGFLDHDTAYKTALNQYLTHCSQIIQQAIHSNDCSILKTNRVGEILGSCIAEIVG